MCNNKASCIWTMCCRSCLLAPNPPYSCGATKQTMSHYCERLPSVQISWLFYYSIHSIIISTEYSRSKQGLLTDHLRHGTVEFKILCRQVIRQSITKVQRCYTEGYRVQQRLVWQTVRQRFNGFHYDAIVIWKWRTALIYKSDVLNTWNLQSFSSAKSRKEIKLDCGFKKNTRSGWALYIK